MVTCLFAYETFPVKVFEEFSKGLFTIKISNQKLQPYLSRLTVIQRILKEGKNILGWKKVANFCTVSIKNVVLNDQSTEDCALHDKGSNI